MQRVVVSTQPEEDCLFRSRLIFYDMCRCLVLGDRFGLRRTSDDFGEFLAGGFGAKVKRS